MRIPVGRNKEVDTRIIYGYLNHAVGPWNSNLSSRMHDEPRSEMKHFLEMIAGQLTSPITLTMPR
jgi:hypothetical protein